MADALLHGRRQRTTNYSLQSLEQKGRGASTPGWLGKTRRSSAGSPGGASQGSGASSKENKAPASRGRPAAKKSKSDAAAKDKAGAKVAKPSGRAKSADGTKKAAEVAVTPKPTRAGRKSAPAKANVAHKKQAVQPAADTPGASAGSKGRKQDAEGRTGEAAAEPASTPQEGGPQARSAEAVEVVPGSRTRAAARKRPLSDAAQSAAGASQKRRRTEPDAPADGAAAKSAGDAAAAAVDTAREADADGAAAAPEPQQQQPPRRSSGRGRKSGSASNQNGEEPAAATAAGDTPRPAAQPARQQAERSAAQSKGGSGGASRQAPAASTPGSDLARRVDANLQAIQVTIDHEHLQQGLLLRSLCLDSARKCRARQCSIFVRTIARPWRCRCSSLKTASASGETTAIRCLPQADYAKLQDAYKALKQQAAEKQAERAPALPASPQPSDSYLKLQVQRDVCAPQIQHMPFRGSNFPG